jgi:hypothetical protein
MIFTRAHTDPGQSTGQSSDNAVMQPDPLICQTHSFWIISSAVNLSLQHSFLPLFTGKANEEEDR